MRRRPSLAEVEAERGVLQERVRAAEAAGREQGLELARLLAAAEEQRGEAEAHRLRLAEAEARAREAARLAARARTKS